jgi:hypothetical protein
MANTYPIRISDQATILQSVLADWATQKGGSATVVSNLRDLWEQSTLQSQVPRILICFNGCRSRGAFSVANALHREDRDWIVAVTRGRGFNAVRGDSLNKPVQNAEPFYDSVETVRDIIRGIQNLSAEAPTVDYKGISPMQMGNLVVDGYQISFSTANDIVGFSSTGEGVL